MCARACPRLHVRAGVFLFSVYIRWRGRLANGLTLLFYMAGMKHTEREIHICVSVLRVSDCILSVLILIVH